MTTDTALPVDTTPAPVPGFTGITGFTQVTVTGAGRMMASAAVSARDRHRVLVTVHVEAGHLPVQTRPRLVDSVVAAVLQRGVPVVDLVLPRGDAQLWECVAERLRITSTHPSGATVLVHAALDEDRAAGEQVEDADRWHVHGPGEVPIEVTVRSLS